MACHSQGGENRGGGRAVSSGLSLCGLPWSPRPRQLQRWSRGLSTQGPGRRPGSGWYSHVRLCVPSPLPARGAVPSQPGLSRPGDLGLSASSLCPVGTEVAPHPCLPRVMRAAESSFPASFLFQLHQGALTSFSKPECTHQINSVYEPIVHTVNVNLRVDTRN